VVHISLSCLPDALLQAARRVASSLSVGKGCRRAEVAQMPRLADQRNTFDVGRAAAIYPG